MCTVKWNTVLEKASKSHIWVLRYVLGKVTKRVKVKKYYMYWSISISIFLTINVSKVNNTYIYGIYFILWVYWLLPGQVSYLLFSVFLITRIRIFFIQFPINKYILNILLWLWCSNLQSSKLLKLSNKCVKYKVKKSTIFASKMFWSRSIKWQKVEILKWSESMSELYFSTYLNKIYLATFYHHQYTHRQIQCILCAQK